MGAMTVKVNYLIIGPTCFTECSPVLVRSSVRKMFFSELALLVFSDFLHKVRGLQILKSSGAQFLWKIHFCPNLRKMVPQIGYFIVIFFYLKIIQNESPSQTPSQNSCSGVIAQMFLTSQVAGFFKKIEGSS